MNSTRIEPRIRFLSNLREAHERSGLSYREVGMICDIDHSYVGRILKGVRIPARDVLISLLVFAYGLSRLETDELLVLVGYPPLGRSIRREAEAILSRSRAPSVEIQSENFSSG